MAGDQVCGVQGLVAAGDAKEVGQAGRPLSQGP